MTMMRLLAAATMLAASCLLANASDDAESKLKGRYEIWEDFEGGTVCKLFLDDEMSIGGNALEGDDQCMQSFKLDGDPNAWFVDDEGKLVLIDAMRRVLVRFEPHSDGSFYANRTADGLESLNLTPES
jgi:hypothetical protein